MVPHHIAEPNRLFRYALFVKRYALVHRKHHNGQAEHEMAHFITHLMQATSESLLGRIGLGKNYWLVYNINSDRFYEKG